MAKKNEKQTSNFFTKVRKFFLGIFHELKLVVWPNEKTFKQAIGTVFLLSIIAGFIIFVVDQTMRIILDFVGFNDPISHQTQEVEPEVSKVGVVVTEPSATTTEASESTTATTITTTTTTGK